MSEKKSRKIICEGPASKKNGALFLRFQPEGKRKNSLEIFPGQILEMGKDVTENDAKRLLSLTNWKFSEVK